MEELITQVKYTIHKKIFTQDKEATVLCTMTDPASKLWTCEFANVTLSEIANFIVEFFYSTTVEVEEVNFTILGAKSASRVALHKSTQRTPEHYLMQMASQINIG